MNPPRKLHIKSYGCQMNVYDAQRMVDTLARENFVETDTVADADLVILNTCHIREKASEKVYSELGRLRETKDDAALKGRELKIVVAGCVAQAEGAEIVRRAPVVDVVVGPQSYQHLPDLLRRAARDGRAIETEFPLQDKFASLAPAATRSHPRTRHHVFRHGAGRLRQVLHVLRRALHARRGGLAAGGEDRRRRAAAGRQRRARNHPDRPERQRLPWRGP